MMKKGMIKFLATGMTALTLMGTATAFAPATQVFAAEVKASADDSEDTYEVKKMSIVEADAYLRDLLKYADLYEEYDNIQVYRCGNKQYAISTYDMGIGSIRKKFGTWVDAYRYFEECNRRGMTDGYIEEENITMGDSYLLISATVTGKLPMVNVCIGTYTIKPVETIKLTADATKIRPGESVSIIMETNEGADESTVNWRLVGPEDVADFYTMGKEAIVSGYDIGTVMVVAETGDGVRDCISIDICNF